MTASKQHRLCCFPWRSALIDHSGKNQPPHHCSLLLKAYVYDDGSFDPVDYFLRYVTGGPHTSQQRLTGLSRKDYVTPSLRANRVRSESCSTGKLSQPDMYVYHAYDTSRGYRKRSTCHHSARSPISDRGLFSLPEPVEKS